ncbi:MAG TPA: hypothetical protein VKK79_13235 [Candidatus Lokiarchaeia archaeon]|nr:hypothetical protein [Candidatus Lokiarchaeia archaeon]
MKWLEDIQIQYLENLVYDEATQVLDETARVARKLWELQHFPQHVQDAIAFFIAICHMSGPSFSQIDLQAICEELGVSQDLLLLAGDHWADVYNYPRRENLPARIGEMALFFYGEQGNNASSEAQ